MGLTEIHAVGAIFLKCATLVTIAESRLSEVQRVIVNGKSPNSNTDQRTRPCLRNSYRMFKRWFSSSPCIVQEDPPTHMRGKNTFCALVFCSHVYSTLSQVGSLHCACKISCVFNENVTVKPQTCIENNRRGCAWLTMAYMPAVSIAYIHSRRLTPNWVIPGLCHIQSVVWDTTLCNSTTIQCMKYTISPLSCMNYTSPS